MADEETAELNAPQKQDTPYTLALCPPSAAVSFVVVAAIALAAHSIILGHQGITSTAEMLHLYCP